MHDIGSGAALDLWSGFPVDATPRPLVILSGRDVVAPARGFPDSVTKCAWCDGAFDPPDSFPPSAERAAGLPISDSRTAFDVLCVSGDGQGSDTTLAVTSMMLSTATFETDRGRRELPAWLITLAGVLDPAAVLAVDPIARFAVPPVLDLHRIGGARAHPDDRTLTVTFSGELEFGHPPPDYEADVLESRTAVAVRITRTTPRPTGPNVGVGQLREIDVNLRDPLGARVLVDGTSGAPRPVIR